MELTRALPPTVVLVLSLLAVVSAEAGLRTSSPAGGALVAHAATDERDAESASVAAVPRADDLDGEHRAALDFEDADAAGMMSGSLSNAPEAAWYHLAAAEHGVSDHLLRALHQVESNAAPGGCIANLEASGAVGPLQFKRATFGQYGVDANQDGDRDICSFADSLFSAARYLRVLGASDLDSAATRKALVRYGTDPDRVLTLARHYREVAARTP
jgi:hypothetical protein